MAAVQSKPHAAGYVNACGTPAAREAIAKYHSYPEHVIDSDNVIVANGCSGSLELALTTLLDPGSILLVPQPGFPLYQVIAESHGATVLPYRLDPDNQWQIDLTSLEEQLLSARNDANGGVPTIRAILLNNPSNPTGAVYPKSHLRQLVNLCCRYQLPIVADEVYSELTFGSNAFYPMAQIAAQAGQQVPVITVSGLAKNFLLPGWRLGWLTFHDK